MARTSPRLSVRCTLLDDKYLFFMIFTLKLRHMGRDSVTERLPHITTPTLVVVGEHDIATPPSKARRLYDGIPRAGLFVVPGAGHCASIEQPALVAERLRAFLAVHA
jgi:pimeloyl-ACP methyl ester carboxylesterase